MAVTKTARIERVGGSFQWILEGAPTVLLAPDPQGFIPETKPRGYADLNRITRNSYGEFTCHFDDGTQYDSVKLTSAMWECEAPIMGPPPTLDAIPAIVVRMSGILVTRLMKYTAYGPVRWRFTKSSDKISASIQGSTLRVRSQTTPGKYTIRVTLTDQWDRSVSRTVSVHVPRRPVINDLRDQWMYPNKSYSLPFSITYEGSSPAASVAVSNSLASVTVSGSGTRRFVNMSTKGSTGVQTITVTLRDQWGYVVQRSFVLHIDPPPPTWTYPMDIRYPWTTYSDGGGSHSGGAVDIGTGAGNSRPLIAVTSGQILFAAWEGLGGNVIIIQGPNGEGLVFAHLNEMYVGVGQWVTAGQVIGRTGWTGDPGGVVPPGPAGAHLHVEVRQYGVQWGPWIPAVAYYASKGVAL